MLFFNRKRCAKSEYCVAASYIDRFPIFFLFSCDFERMQLH